MNTLTAHVLAAAAGAIALGAACPRTAAQSADNILPIVFRTDFEPPAYLAGPLAGQDKWTVHPEFSARLAVVEKSLGPGGSQAVRIAPGAFLRTDSQWNRRVEYQVTPSMPVLKVEWDAQFPLSKQPSDAWHTALYDTKGGLLCGLVVTPAGATYLTQGPEPVPVVVPVPRDVWNHFEMRLNFTSATVDFLMNGVPFTPDPIPSPLLTPDGWIGSVGFEVLNPGFDEVYLDSLSITPFPFICRPNCDGSLEPPILNVLDFMCFHKAFVGALEQPPEAQVMSYANFDGSIQEPVLNVNDYMAFLSAFAAGCR